MRSTQLLVALAATIPAMVRAHIALWDEGMYGWDPSDPNQVIPVQPLYADKFADWWFHGYINTPPPTGAMMSLPAGGTYHGEVACNKALTSYGSGTSLESVKYACDTIGPMHTADDYGTANPKDVKGCGIAIAYESDVSKIQPEDFAVISTNYNCPWLKDVDFQIPSDLPACPEGGCHCMWGWVHSADSGSEQMYFVGYRCNVTGATGTQPIPAPKTANKCNYPTDTSNCTVGPKQPHYWLQAERNNNFQGYYDPPFYNGAYGFMDGAQTDLFAGKETATKQTMPASSATSTKMTSSNAVPAPASPTTTTSSLTTTAMTTTVASQAVVASNVASSAETTSTSTSTMTTTSLIAQSTAVSPIASPSDTTSTSTTTATTTSLSVQGVVASDIASSAETTSTSTSMATDTSLTVQADSTSTFASSAETDTSSMKSHRTKSHHRVHHKHTASTADADATATSLAGAVVLPTSGTNSSNKNCSRRRALPDDGEPVEPLKRHQDRAEKRRGRQAARRHDVRADKE